MDAFIGIVGFFGIIIGVVLLVVGFVKKKKLKGGLVLGVSLVLLIIALSLPSDDDTKKVGGEKTPVTKEVDKVEETEKKSTSEKVTPEIQTEEKVKKDTNKKITSTQSDWKTKVKETASMNGTETAKFDSISLYAKDYKPSKKEVSEFAMYIIEQYTEGNYLASLSNDEYVLGNIFKADVVDRYYKQDQGNPYGDFAFDFWQNSKYVYRGVDDIASDSVKSNERQMDKALVKIKNKE